VDVERDVEVDRPPTRADRRATRKDRKRQTVDVEVPGNGKNRPSARSAKRDKALRELLAGLRDMRAGDFSTRIEKNGDPLMAEIADVFNEVAANNQRLEWEMGRISRTVGREGDMSARADTEGLEGGWERQLTSLNALVADLVSPTTEVARVLQAAAAGDLSQKMVLELDGKMVQGEFLRIATTVNTMVDQLNAFAAEVTRVAREVGTEGRLGGQASVPGVAGTWKDLTDSVNAMANNLTNQVRNIADVTTAVARGDLSRKITVEARGEVQELKNTINTMVDQLNAFAGEVTRVAREVGTEGVLGGQAQVPGVAGTWKDLTDSVNAMASNLTDQVRNIAHVTTAVARGDLSRKITVDVKGEILELKDTVNTMVDQLNAFASEVTRVSWEVGTEGKLGGQAIVPGAAGVWRALTDSVNAMAGNLTVQLRDVSAVATGIASGDLTRKITVEARGEVLQIKDVINRMVDSLGAFASEVTRVAREVGAEGRLGGQANVPGVTGTWKDLTDNVNFMANSLTEQVRNIADVTTSVARGDLSRKITVDARGEILEVKNTVNTMVDQLNSFASEVTRVAKEVGTEGRLGGQADVRGVAGVWKDLTDNVNFMASNLTSQVRNIADVTTAVARGDLSRKITVDVRGEVAELKNTINTMVDQLNAFAGEVTRVAREVGFEGKLGGQANVPGVAGTWRDLTDSVNAMAANLTSQVRNIADVTTAVAKGDLSQKITVDVRGEVLELKNTINNMVEQLRTFADEVTRVAKEVGTEGNLGGQAEVPGAAGVWRALTDNVNAMANSLTLQVRAIADVATAVTKGDLTRQITVEAQGEIDELKRNLNEMIVTLRETTTQNQEQDWLKTNLAKFSRMMQGQKDLQSVSRQIMSELTPLVGAQHGTFFLADNEGGQQVLKLIASYAYKTRKHVANRFQPGEGLVGQAALEKKPIVLTNVPDDYIHITSGLGEAPPRSIIVLPVLFEGEVKAVIELASFLPFSQIHQTFLDQLQESIGVVLNMISASMRTEELLNQSQNLTQELQSQSEELRRQQEELRKSNADLEMQAKSLKASEELLRDQQEELQQVNEELEEKASLLAEQNKKVEQKNAEVEAARLALEEKAEQLALSSKYKSEFLANMSHELRTPLNSLLILARLLADNREGNLTPKQVEFSQTILQSGSDLLTLINDVLDLSKVEAGKMEVMAADVSLPEVVSFVERSFRPMADQKHLDFEATIAPGTPETIRTDSQRLQQILRNLLGNAFKFTEQGGVSVTIRRAETGRKFSNPNLDSAESVVAFAVKDSGIGIARDKQKLIFEAFQQADGTTNRRFGGTGLGLSISREIARLLGGEIRVESEPGKGSTFTLFLPSIWEPPADSEDRTSGPLMTMSVEDAAPPQARAGGMTATVKAQPRPRMSRVALDHNPLDDDRMSLEAGDRIVLIVEAEPQLAKEILERAREKGFKGLVAQDGQTALALANEFRPDAITLDGQLGEEDGLAVLDQLKHSPETRHIPVHIISGVEKRQQGLKAGAIAQVEKPLTREKLDDAFARITNFIDTSVKRLLVVEDDETQRSTIVELIEADDIEITAVATAAEALKELEARSYDCMVLDLGLRDSDGFELLERVKGDASMRDLPIIIYTGRELKREDEARLRRYAQTIIIKDAKSPERLLDETALFLHRVEARLPEQKRRMLERLHDADAVFAGKHVLIVDDDMRNVFSLTSVMEAHGMQVSYAENGREALEKLEGGDLPDVVLMDVMMPEMDGYEATRAIRSKPRLRSLPIISLTAKAMKGDREKCIAAGASDYITKPVDVEQLLSLMRVWLYK
jgi:HAMP domain-containing protein/signal transduction histidine kinase/CheY-like chemotaxis protein